MMYSKYAKYKQILNCDWLGLDVMQFIAGNNADKEDFIRYHDIIADYYWLPGIGMYVIIDKIKEVNRLGEYRGFKMLNKNPNLEHGRYVWSSTEAGERPAFPEYFSEPMFS